MTAAVFEVVTASFQLEADAHGGDSAEIHLGLRLLAPQSVVNQQGTFIPKDQWTLILHDQASSTRLEKAASSLGFAKFRPPSQISPQPSCILQVEVKPSHFSRLLAAVTAGHLPSQAQIVFSGAEDVDGAILWDMRKNAFLPVVDAMFEVSLGAKR